MIKVIETTFEEPYLNHEYFLSDDKFQCLGYIPFGEKEPKMFQFPMKFSTKGRKFRKLK